MCKIDKSKIPTITMMLDNNLRRSLLSDESIEAIKTVLAEERKAIADDKAIIAREKEFASDADDICSRLQEVVAATAAARRALQDIKTDGDIFNEGQRERLASDNVETLGIIDKIPLGQIQDAISEYREFASTRSIKESERMVSANEEIAAFFSLIIEINNLIKAYFETEPGRRTAILRDIKRKFGVIIETVPSDMAKTSLSCCRADLRKRLADLCSVVDWYIEMAREAHKGIRNYLASVC